MVKIRGGKASFWWGVVVVIIDQGMKWWWLVQGWPVVINRGGPLGLLPGWGWVVLVAVMLVYLWLTQRQTWAGWLVVGGGFSNLIDRWLRGGVVDMFGLFKLPMFNLADGVIMIGVGWLIWNRR